MYTSINYFCVYEYILCKIKDKEHEQNILLEF